MLIKASCRYCANNVEFGEDQLGQQATCPHCGNAMILARPPAPEWNEPTAEPVPLRAKRQSPLTIAGLVALIFVCWLLYSFGQTNTHKKQVKKDFKNQLITLRVSIKEGISLTELRRKKTDLNAFFEINKGTLADYAGNMERINYSLNGWVLVWELKIRDPEKDFVGRKLYEDRTVQKAESEIEKLITDIR